MLGNDAVIARHNHSPVDRIPNQSFPRACVQGQIQISDRRNDLLPFIASINQSSDGSHNKQQTDRSE
jgi:hypothetical protein